MKESMISFRCSAEDIDLARTISRQNEISLSSYIISALVHYIHAKVQQGEMDLPPFLAKLPRQPREWLRLKRKDSNHIA